MRVASAQGAHGFRAQSRWAPRVGAFINLESTGPGGPDFVFQARLQGMHPAKAYTASSPGQGIYAQSASGFPGLLPDCMQFGLTPL